MSTNQRGPGEGEGQLGRYRLIAELGHGGMAEVYLADMRGQGNFHKLVVIKQIRAELAEDPEFLGMFLDEARLAARLSHPNVVQTNEVGDENGRYFMAMEYLDGQPLSRVRHRLAGKRDLPLSMYLRILADVLAGLHHAHELHDFDGAHLGVVHRDVTPPNVFITYDGEVKVVDFGIAKARNSAAETKAGVVKGKVSYMAPEQARGEPPIDRRADVFAVGVLLWEAATGARLWKGMPELTILKHLLMGDIPAASSVSPDVAPALDAIIRKAMSPDRDDRYPTAAAMQSALEDYLAELGEEVSRREMGRRVAEAFRGDRARMKAVIDEQLAAPADGTAALPFLDHPTTSELFSIAPHAPITEPPPQNSSRPRLPSLAPEALASEPPPQHPSRPTLTNVTNVATVTHASTAPPHREATQLRPAVLAGVSLVAAAAVILGLWLPTRPGAHSAEAATAAALPPATAQRAPVRLSLSASPPEAVLLLDGKPLGASPFEGSFPHDDTVTHTLRIEAPGFLPRQDTVVFDRDRVMEVALTPSPTSAAPLAREPAPTPAPRGWVAPTPNPPHGKPLRPLDRTNPYAP
jgi:serine/threonine-protein kinase